MFETAVRGLHKQGRKSTTDRHDFCLYRGLGGSKCAVGFLIPDGIYTPAMEGRSVERLGIFPREEYTFLDEMQLRLHDRLREKEFRSDLLPAARRFAVEWGLKPTFLDELEGAAS
jgi:hypothetical protein